MKRIVYIFVALLFCVSSLWAEVYTIDFNKGTKMGDNSYSGLPKNNAAAFCINGSENILGYSKSDCFYNDKGCGLRIGELSAGSTGSAFLIVTFSKEIQEKYIVKIVVYASRGTSEESAELGIYAGTNEVTREFSFAKMKDYDSSYPESSNYILPEIVLERSFKMLKIQAQNPNYAMLHRIDIYTADEASLTLPAQSGVTHYATFSNDKATFFPTDATVSKASVCGGRLSVTNLESQEGLESKESEGNLVAMTGCYVPANTGVLVASTSSSTSYYVLDGETLDALTDNMLKPASEDMEGNYKFYKLAYDDYDNKTGLGFYWGAADGGAFSCKTGTAYLAVSGESSVKGFILDEASDEDAIKSLTPDFSQGRGEIYNMTGQRISKPVQGIYIKGGRKYVGK